MDYVSTSDISAQAPSLVCTYIDWLVNVLFVQTLSGAVVCVVQVWDLRQNKLIYNMHGHGDSVTGLALSSEGSYLLSNSMDNTGRMSV